MPNEKKYTLDDILAEYDDNTDSDTVSVGDAASEEAGVNGGEYDNYEDCEEQDVSESFSAEPMFAPAEVYGEGADEEEIFADDEEDYGEDADIGYDGDTEDGTETSEFVEAEPEENEENEPEIVGMELPEEFIGSEFQADESFDNDIKDWQAAGIAEEIELPETKSEETEEVPQRLDTETAEDNAAEQDTGDVNDKLVTRMLKAIFPVKGDSVGEVIRKIIFIIAVVVFVGAGIMLVSTLIQSRQAIDIQESNKSVITTTVATSINEKGEVVTIKPTEDEKIQHNFDVAEYYKGINEDYVGYLEVAGCDIYEPVVQAEDNEKYLHTTLYGGTNKSGTIFADYRCTISEDYMSPNIVLYGHNQEDLTMFGSLKDYKQNIEFYRENPVVNFNPAFESGEYLIYGYFVTHVYENQDSNGIVFHYQDYIETMNDERTFNWYINEVQKRNQIVTPVDVKFGDKLLCLSTCSNEFSNSRFVVFARKLREGESVSDYDFDKAYLNGNAQALDWDAITSGDIPEVEDDGDETEEEINEPAVKSLNKHNPQTEITRLVTEETEAETTTETTTMAETTETTTTTETTETTTKKTKTKTKTETTETTEAADTSEAGDEAAENTGDVTTVPPENDEADSSGTETASES